MNRCPPRRANGRRAGPNPGRSEHAQRIISVPSPRARGALVTVEQAIAAALGAYLTARADRLATDVGVLEVRADRGLGVVRVSLNGAPYLVTLVVRPA